MTHAASPAATPGHPARPTLWVAFVALVRKDLVLYLSNRRALIMGLLAPVFIAAFFGYLFDSKQAKVSRIPVAITDLDGSALSRQVVAALQADTSLSLSQLPEAEARQAVVKGQQRAAIVLPAGLGQAVPGALFGGQAKPQITIHHDPSQQMVLPMVNGLLAQHLMAAVGGGLFGGAAQGAGGGSWIASLRRDVAQGNGLDEARRRDLLAMFDSVAKVQAPAVSASASASAPATGASAPAAGSGFSTPFTTRALAATARTGLAYNSYSHAFAGMGVQFILMMGIEFGVALLMMRRQGLWQRLRAAPLPASVPLGSRIASAALIALGLLAGIFAAGALLFGVRIEGSVAGFIGICLAFAVLTASFGLVIAALGKTPETTRGLAILATLLMVMLGGAWVPSFMFPEWLQTVSLAVPTRWAVDGFDAVTWRGQGLDAALGPIGVMLAFSAAFTALAIWRFDWRE